jgi:hypothetical protein
MTTTILAITFRPSHRLCVSDNIAYSMSNPNEPDITPTTEAVAIQADPTPEQTAAFLLKAQSKRIAMQASTAKDVQRIAANRQRVGGDDAMNELIKEHQAFAAAAAAGVNAEAEVASALAGASVNE